MSNEIIDSFCIVLLLYHASSDKNNLLVQFEAINTVLVKMEWFHNRTEKLS